MSEKKNGVIPRPKGSLPKAYLRIDPNIDQTHSNVGEYVKLLCAASRQPRRGRFKTEAVLIAAVGKMPARRAIEDKDVVPEDDHLYVKAWDLWQEGDVTVGERVARWRATHNAAVTP